MPSDQGYTTWVWTIAGKDVPYGLFLGEVVNFLIVSLALFFFTVKFLGWIMRLRKEQVEEKKKVPPLTKDQELLTEIRDLLRAGRDGSVQPAADVPG
jgi:large conductance mechanosensitive channel